MRGDLVTRGGDGEHDFRMVLGDPSEHKESAARAVPIEPVEQRIDASRQPARARCPLLAREGRFQRLYLEIFLDVDCEEVRSRIWVHEKERGGAHGAETALPWGSHFKCQPPSLTDSSPAH